MKIIISNHDDSTKLQTLGNITQAIVLRLRSALSFLTGLLQRASTCKKGANDLATNFSNLQMCTHSAGVRNHTKLQALQGGAQGRLAIALNNAVASLIIWWSTSIADRCWSSRAQKAAVKRSRCQCCSIPCLLVFAFVLLAFYIHMWARCQQ